jgi:hypothetical protein
MKLKTLLAALAVVMLPIAAYAQTTVLDQNPAPVPTSANGPLNSELLTQSIAVAGGTLYVSTLRGPGQNGVPIATTSTFAPAGAAANTVTAGQSGVSGAVDIFPATASKGYVEVTTSNNAGNTKTGVNFAAQAAARTMTIPDPGSTTANFLLSAQTEAANGLFATPLNLLAARNADGSVVAAGASAGKFGYAVALATSFAMASESANNNTKTDDCLFEYVLPAWYVAGQNVTVTVNASITGSGTLSTKTAQIKAYRTASNGTQGADIGPGSASAMTAGGADVAFTITGTTLNPGDKIVLELETVLIETASSGMVANINSVRVS